MWYSGQSYPVISQATRGLGLVKRLRCSSVFKQRYSFKGGRDKWEIRPVFSGNNGWATSNLFQENLLSVWSLRAGSLWRHIIIVLFSLIVEDHRLWFVGIKLYIFDASLICRRWDRLRGQSCDNLSASRSLPSITEVWPSVVYFEYCRFLLYRTEPYVKKFEVVDCDFIAVPLILAVLLFLVLFLNHCRIYCTLG